MNDRSRPQAAPEKSSSLAAATKNIVTQPDAIRREPREIAAARCRRWARDARRRAVRLGDEVAARLDDRPVRCRPCDYGLSRRELAAERARLRAAGWTSAEIDCRLTRPQQVPGDGWTA